MWMLDTKHGTEGYGSKDAALEMQKRYPGSSLYWELIED